MFSVKSLSRSKVNAHTNILCTSGLLVYVYYCSITDEAEWNMWVSSVRTSMQVTGVPSVLWWEEPEVSLIPREYFHHLKKKRWTAEITHSQKTIAYNLHMVIVDYLMSKWNAYYRTLVEKPKNCPQLDSLFICFTALFLCLYLLNDNKPLYALPTGRRPENSVTMATVEQRDKSSCQTTNWAQKKMVNRQGRLSEVSSSVCYCNMTLTLYVY